MNYELKEEQDRILVSKKISTLAMYEENASETVVEFFNDDLYNDDEILIETYRNSFEKVKFAFDTYKLIMAEIQRLSQNDENFTVNYISDLYEEEYSSSNLFIKNFQDAFVEKYGTNVSDYLEFGNMEFAKYQKSTILFIDNIMEKDATPLDIAKKHKYNYCLGLALLNYINVMSYR